MSRAWNSWPIKSTQNETRLPCHGGGGGGGCAEGGGWSSFGVELWTSPLDQLHISRWCASFLPLLPSCGVQSVGAPFQSCGRGRGKTKVNRQIGGCAVGHIAEDLHFSAFARPKLTFRNLKLVFFKLDIISFRNSNFLKKIGKKSVENYLQKNMKNCLEKILL